MKREKVVITGRTSNHESSGVGPTYITRVKGNVMYQQTQRNIRMPIGSSFVTAMILTAQKINAMNESSYITVILILIITQIL